MKSESARFASVVCATMSAGRRWLRRRHAVSSPFLVGALTAFLISPGTAQVDRIYRSVRALTNKELQLALFGRANTKECKPLPVPQIHVITPPEHGSLTVRTTTVTTNQSPNCPNLSLPAQVLLYKSESNYVGSDLVSFTVTFENGQMQGHQISIAVVKEGEPSKAEEL